MKIPVIQTACVGLFAALMVMMLSIPVRADIAPPGWRFYNEPREATPVKPQKVLPLPVPAPPKKRVMSATEQLAWFHRQWNEAKAAAFLDPKNEAKLQRFLTLNRYITAQTGQTAMTFKKVLLEHPALSYTRDHPTEQAARKTYLATLKTRHENKVREMVRKGWGLFFVYDGHDALAAQLAPSLQQFADRYQLELLGLSNDDVLLPSLRENRHNQGKIAARYTPAILLVNPNTAEIKPLAYGFISQSRLLIRFYNVATDFKQAQ